MTTDEIFANPKPAPVLARNVSTCSNPRKLSLFKVDGVGSASVPTTIIKVISK